MNWEKKGWMKENHISVEPVMKRQVTYSFGVYNQHASDYIVLSHPPAAH